MHREPTSFALLGLIITLHNKYASSAHVNFSLELTAKSLLNLTGQFTQHVFLEYSLYEGQGQLYLCP
jgi:hypothetical protein